MSRFHAAVMDFLSQPWGMGGAVCIMLAITCFNSLRLQRRFAAMGIGDTATAILLNALNLVGGACLLVNAVLRREVVWVVLETYFVGVAIKGLFQVRRKRVPASTHAAHAQ